MLDRGLGLGGFVLVGGVCSGQHRSLHLRCARVFEKAQAEHQALGFAALQRRHGCGHAGADIFRGAFAHAHQQHAGSRQAG